MKSTSDVKRKSLYGKLDKMKITKYAYERGTVVKYKGEFPSLTECTVHGWLKVLFPACRKRSEFKNSYIWKKSERSLYLTKKLDEKLRAFIIHMPVVGEAINHHVVFRVLIALLKLIL